MGILRERNIHISPINELFNIIKAYVGHQKEWDFKRERTNTGSDQYPTSS